MLLMLTIVGYPTYVGFYAVHVGACMEEAGLDGNAFFFFLLLLLFFLFYVCYSGSLGWGRQVKSMDLMLGGITVKVCKALQGWIDRTFSFCCPSIIFFSFPYFDGVIIVGNIHISCCSDTAYSLETQK